MNGLLPDEAIVFVDEVYPECQSRPAHGWFIRSEKPAIRSTTGRQRLNLHAAFDLEKMRATIGGGEKTSAAATLWLPGKLEWDYPCHRVIHVYLDNARYHHARKQEKPNPSWNGRTAASGCISCRPTTPI